VNPARRELEAFLGAVRFFTRLPVPGWVGHSAAGLNASARYFPAVGLIVGGIGALVFLLALRLWPPPLALLMSMGATIYLTGAFHEDGLADAADGMGGGWTKEDVLRIMKDSRTGSYGVVALAMVLLGKFVALTQMPVAWVPAVLVAGHAWSRFCSTALIATLDYVREDALSKAKPLATRLSPGALAIAASFAASALWACNFLVGSPLLLVLAVALSLLVTLWLARKMVRRLGGYTGDLLGAVQQVSELAFYLGMAASGLSGVLPLASPS
jgi:adenosylcobinamide-GDP ribazoletransferase